MALWTRPWGTPPRVGERPPTGQVNEAVAQRKRRGGSLFRHIIVAAITCAALGLLPGPAFATGPNAVMTPAGYNASSVARGDDTSNLVVNLPFAMNWNGTNYTQVYINMNGNCTFGAGYTGYDPNITLAATNRSIMAPFWADVDTRNTAASQVTYSTTTPGSIPQVNGRNAFLVNWVNVARYNNQSTPTNSFQLVLVDRSDTGAGNFDFIFNYDQVTWDIGTSASSVRARAGWGFAGTGFELPGSGTAQAGASALLDASPQATSLIQNSMNSGGQLGRYVFQVRSGQAPNIPPQVTVVNRTLEGNAGDSYTGYAGVGDASAFDPDGTIAGLTHDRPAVLPLGTTTVTWTAIDNRGAITTAQQSVLVRDTTAPTNPTLSSPTHSTGVWTTNTTVTATSSGSADVCSGVRGFSYAWSQGSPSAPDTVTDPMTTEVVTTDIPVAVDDQTFPDATWPVAWTRSDATYVRLTNVAARTQGTYAAEIWANNTTRRTVNFYRDYDLTGLTSATLAFWDNMVLSGGADYARVEYSTNGGASYTQLRNVTATSGWTRRTYSLPVGGIVRVRFSGSVNATTEYIDHDNISVAGIDTVTSTVLSTNTTASLADGTWYFNLRTVDNADNWSTATNLGPFLIDTVAPSTSDNAPAGWSTAPVTLALTATDAGQIAYTRYRINGGAWTNYTGPIAISAEGTTTVSYYSADAAGHLESARTTTVRIDSLGPSVPASVSASATSTRSVEVAWGASTDAVSGLAAYRVYRDGVLVGTTTSRTYVDTGLEPGGTYVYRIAAVDGASNQSALSAPASATTPSSTVWLTVSDASVDLGTLTPELDVTTPSATTVTVGGVGELAYDLSCAGSDFVNSNPSSPTPTMPIGTLGFATRGWTTAPFATFSGSPRLVGSSVGSPYVWQHAYIFDYSINVPLSVDPGSYSSQITYTVVSR